MSRPVRIALAMIACLLLTSFHQAQSSRRSDAANDPQPIDPSQITFEVRTDGTVAICYRRVPIISGRYMFWGESWAWANARINIDGEAKRQIRGGIDRLQVEVSGEVTVHDDRVLQLDYVFRPKAAGRSVIGGGIEWRIVADAEVLGGINTMPHVMHDATGWRWQLDAENAIELNLEAPLGSCFAEKGDVTRMRTFLMSGKLPNRDIPARITLKLPRGAHEQIPLEARLADSDPATWYHNPLDALSVPVDVSFLNANHRPAGRHGFLKFYRDEFVFEDGTPARFWGTNVAAYSLFLSEADIQSHARRISQLGFNLVRLHHHDSAWVKPNVFRADSSTTRLLNERALNKIDWWIKCLKDEGIYVWLDLHVGRTFREDDQIPGFEEISKRKGEGKGFCYFNERLQELMQEFNTEFLTRVNPFTGQRYTDDPAIALLQITNENDLTHHFGNLMLADKKNPHHQEIFESKGRSFASQFRLPVGPVLRTWQSGPGKLFLADAEHHFNQRMLSHLRDLGVQVPISTTSYWGGSCASALLSLGDGDFVDVHAYGGPFELTKNPFYQAGFLDWIGAAQLEGRPLTVSEWNVSYPTRDRGTSPLSVAARACLQGWDAVLVYNYAQGAAIDQRLQQWSTAVDPSMATLMPAAALMYRQRHIRQARRHVRFDLSREQIMNAEWSPANSAALRLGGAVSKVSIGLPELTELPWMRPKTDQTSSVTPQFERLNMVEVASDSGQITSDTGEICRNWRDGVETIDTPVSQAAYGFVGDREVQLNDVQFVIENASASVVVASLDGAPISESRRLLIAAAGQAENRSEGRGALAEPVVGVVRIRTGHRDSWVVRRAGQTRTGAGTWQSAAGVLELQLPLGSEQSVIIEAVE